MLFISRVIILLLLLTTGAFAQPGTTITGKTFGVTELESLLRRSSPNTELRNCKITQSPSPMPGMNTGALMIPANIRVISFADCTFPDSFISFESPDTGLDMFKCTGVSSLEIGTSGRVSLLECTFNSIVVNRTDTGMDYERIAPRIL